MAIFDAFRPPPALARKGALWQGSARSVGAPLGPILVSGACCRSSVVEHSIGNGEVDSSILSGSTIYFSNIKQRQPDGAPAYDSLHAEQSMKRRALACNISAVGSLVVLARNLVLPRFDSQWPNLILAVA
jgi:hypothetical protein